MFSRTVLFGKLGVSAFRSIESAATFCKLRGNSYVELVHWLHQIMQANDSDLHRIAKQFGISREDIDRGLAHALGQLPAGATSISDFSSHIEVAIERAWLIASLRFGDRKIRTAHLLAALLQTPALRRIALDSCPAFRVIAVDAIDEQLLASISDSPEAQDPPHDGSGFASAIPGEASLAIAPDQQGLQSAFEKYCTDLTKQAKDGLLDPVIGREKEVRTLIDILLRRRQNNPLLTGEAGVGKTAVVEGLALAIASRKVPPPLQSVRLLSLDVGALLAGASMKGEFESRLKAVLEGASHAQTPVILFVDEIHTLIGAGGNAGTGDAANLLKPALARGNLRTIGATTWSEYKRHIEKDAALTRRFQVIQVLEPVEDLAIDMVRGLVSTFEKHHQVLILDEAICAAVTLSQRYIPARQLPDKAISLLDTACARTSLSLHSPPSQLQLLYRNRDAALVERDIYKKQVKFGKNHADEQLAIEKKLNQLEQDIFSLEGRWKIEQEIAKELLAARALHEKDEQNPTTALPSLAEIEHRLTQAQGDAPLVYPEVGASAVATIVSEWTGIPTGRMVKDEIAAVLELGNHLGQRVIGQQHALDQIAQRIQVARAGVADPNKPIGIFLLAGPSGVGKTETALALAESLYGGEQNLITINMSEFQETHTVSTLKGAPPGYVGYGEGGVLTEAVRRRPYSVILLDEIEKAHNDVIEIFFQVFDKGCMEDGEGRQIDFRNTVILLTSNVGADRISDLCSDAALTPSTEALRKAIEQDLLHVFPAAFLGRLSVIPYLPLQTEVLTDIVKLQLLRISKRILEQHDIDVVFDSDLVAHVISTCTVNESGARLVIGYIEQHILPVLGRVWLESIAHQERITRVELCIENGCIAHKTSFQPHLAQPSTKEFS